MKLKTVIIPLLLLFLFSCNNDAVNEPEDKKDQKKTPIELFSQDDVVSGQIMVKLAAEPGQDINFRATRSGEAISTGITGVDEILNNLGIKNMERVFPNAGKFEERTRKEGLHLWYIIEFDEDQPVTRAAADFLGSKSIAIVEPVRRIVPVGRGTMIRAEDTGIGDGSIKRSAVTFNDPHLKNQWHYNNTGTVTLSGGGQSSAGVSAGADMRLYGAWLVTTGDPEVIVSIVDGGVDYNHEDLRDNMWTNSGEIPGNGVDDDGNGYIDDVYGFNFVDNKGAIVEDDHGTHVAGTVAAVNNNGTGVCGIAGGDKTAGKKGARIMSCQIFRHDKTANDVNTAKAIKYGADNGAVISQNSWGYDTGAISSPSSIKDAINYFVKYAGIDENGNQSGPMKGGIVIFAAGNDNKQIKHYPAAENNVISVASIGADYKRAWYSNYGSWIDITAPGGAILQPEPVTRERGVLSTSGEWVGTQWKPGYYYSDGTSMAAPHVSGVAALAIATYGGKSKPGFTPAILESKLLQNTYDINSYNNNVYGLLGTGCLDASATLSSIAIVQIPDIIMKAWETEKELLLSDYFKSPSDRPLTYKIESDNPAAVNAAQSGNYLKLTNISPGTANITVRATNPEPYTVTQSFQVKSMANNKPEIIKQIDDMAYDTFAEQQPILLNYFFRDPDEGDILTYSVTSDNPGIVEFSISNGTLYITTKESGVTNVTLTATDPGGLFVSQTFKSVCINRGQPVKLYPNPAINVLNVKIEDIYEGSGKLMVYSSSGVKVIERSVELELPNVLSIEVGKLSTGTYTLVLEYGIGVANKLHKKNFLKK